MYIEQKLLVKHENKVQGGIVKKIYLEDLEIELEDGTIIRRKFWEVRQIKGTSYEQKN